MKGISILKALYSWCKIRVLYLDGLLKVSTVGVSLQSMAGEEQTLFPLYELEERFQSPELLW